MKKIRIFLASMILFYIACILYITLLSRERSFLRSVVLDLFHSYRLWSRGNGSQRNAILQNISLFVPFGYLVSELMTVQNSSTGKIKRILCVLLVGFLFSLFIEIIQYMTGRGMADIDDLFNNVIGTAIGALLCQLMLLFRLIQVQNIIPIILVCSGFFGCYQMSKMVSGGSGLTRQFWFSVDSVSDSGFSGRCYTYDIPTPSYELKLGSTHVDTKVDGDNFTISVDLEHDREYEVMVTFTGYGTMSTGVYLSHGEVKYISGNVPELEDQLLDGAVLKAYTSDYDTYIYEKAGQLIWLVPPSVEASTEVIYHIHTTETEQLPAGRIQYGFDNRGFKPTAPSIPGSEDELFIGHYRVYIRLLPAEYNVTSIMVGYNPGGGIVWRTSFRP